MDKKVSKQKDVYNKVEYLAVKKHKKQLMLFEHDANGMSRTQLAKIIGDKLGEGTFDLVVKYENNPKLITGKITSIITNKGTGKDIVLPDFSHITDQMKRLEEKFERGSDNQNFQSIMQMKDAAYQIQIDFWKSQCDLLRAENEKLKKQLDSEAGGGNNQLLELLLPVLTQAISK